MTADGNNNAPVIDDNDDLNTTAPHSDPVAWQMPEPVFRQTSGKLPQGFEKNYGLVAAASADGALGTESIPAAVVADESDFYVEPKPKSSILKLILVLLGLAAMVAFIVVFLTVVYFFFLRSD